MANITRPPGITLKMFEKWRSPVRGTLNPQLPVLRSVRPKLYPASAAALEQIRSDLIEKLAALEQAPVGSRVVPAA